MKLIFGDNQFFGINHMSEDKAQEQAERFSSMEHVIRVIDAAWDAGIRDFMFTTHDRVAEICDHFRAHPVRYKGLKVYPAMPYAHKYANLVAEKGILGAVTEAIRGSGSPADALRKIARAGIGALQQDPIEILHILMDEELRMFRDLHVEAIFLQNILTDLLFGLGAHDALAEFVSYAKTRHGINAGFITMNLPGLSTYLLEWNIEHPIVCATFNPVGYLMNPSRASYESTLANGQVRFIAMSVLASGAVSPRDAFEYVSRFPGIEAVLFGASTQRHIEEFVNLFKQPSDRAVAV